MNELTRPSDPTVLHRLITRDRPLSEVRNLDDISVPVRLIRLSPPNAARWAYSTSMGSYDMDAPEVPKPYRTEDSGWVCGPWMARASPLNKKKKGPV